MGVGGGYRKRVQGRCLRREGGSGCFTSDAFQLHSHSGSTTDRTQAVGRHNRRITSHTYVSSKGHHTQGLKKNTRGGGSARARAEIFGHRFCVDIIPTALQARVYDTAPAPRVRYRQKCLRGESQQGNNFFRVGGGGGRRAWVIEGWC